jgi:hypothetical protein
MYPATTHNSSPLLHAPPSKPASTITDDYLIKMNKIGGFLHFAQGTLMLVTYLFVDSVNNFTRPIYNSYLIVVYDDDNEQGPPDFAQDSRKVLDLPIGLVTPFFLYMSAVAHFIIVYNRTSYIDGINNNINRVRWYEYALSSSLMIVMIAVLFGVWDLGNLIGIIGCNFSMNLFGLWMEEVNDLSAPHPTINWAPFILGCISGAIPWLNVMLAFLGAGNFSDIPNFVYGILVSYFVFFNTFPINMLLQYKQYGSFKDYRKGELGYIVLSLVSKSLLAWLVFGGTFQPNGD